MIFMFIGVPFTILNPVARLTLSPGTIDETRLTMSTWIGTLGMLVATIWSTGTDVRIRRWCQSSSSSSRRNNDSDRNSNTEDDEVEAETLLKSDEHGL
jgi:hypothetical protein